MTFAHRIDRLNRLAAAALEPLQPVLLLAIRAYVSWQFLKSGWLKLQDWDTTQYLFQEEYHVPVLSPYLASIVGTFGEIAFPLLLIPGLLGRFGALGLTVVNAMAVVSYAHVLLSEGNEAALGQHVLWGLMLAVLIVFGPGRLAMDEFIARRAARAG